MSDSKPRSERWTPERRAAQSKLAKDLVAEGKLGGPNRGQGRKPQPKLNLDINFAFACPGCNKQLKIMSKRQMSEQLDSAALSDGALLVGEEPLSLSESDAHRPAPGPGDIMLLRNGSVIRF